MNNEHRLEKYWTELRKEIQAWFQRNAPSLGELYEGSLRIIFDGNFPGRTRFVAHAVREIRNRLPDVISGTKSSRVEYVNLLDPIIPEWEKAGFSLDGMFPENFINGQEPKSDIPVPRPLFKKIASLVKEHREKRETLFDKTKRLFDALGGENQKLQVELRPVIMQWIRTTNWFMGLTHDSGAKDSNVDMEELYRYFEIFETTLGALIRGFFKTTEELDEILEDTNF